MKTGKNLNNIDNILRTLYLMERVLKEYLENICLLIAAKLDLLD